MQLQPRRMTCVALLLVAALLGIGGILFGPIAFGWLSMLITDPSFASITSPLDHGILFVDNPVYVRVGAQLAHRNYGSVALYVDGEKYVLDEKLQAFSPKNSVHCSSQDIRYCGSADINLLWMPAGARTYALMVCVFGDEKPAPAWRTCTDTIHVAVVDLSVPLPSAGAYLPQDGDTLPIVAGKFGLPPEWVAAANPKADPASVLPKEVPVSIPEDPSLTPSSAGPVSGSPPWTVEQAKVTTGQPIDKGYCYYSFGGGYWSRFPAGPQTFAYPLSGQLDLSATFSSLAIPPAGGTLAMQCWGWSGATLISLGSGKTTLTPAASPIVRLQGDDFTLEATLKTIPGDFETMGPKTVISPPQNLASTSKLDGCTKHLPPDDIFFGPVIACPDAVKNGDIILIWDWSSPLFPVDDPTTIYATKVDGFHLYQVLGPGKSALVGNISLRDKTVKILPKSMLAAGPVTFFVRAYLGVLESANSNLYTLGSTSAGVATVVIAPRVADYGGSYKKNESWGLSTCSVGLPAIIGSSALVGSDIAVGYEHFEPDDSCLNYYWEYSRARLVFDLGAVKGPVSSAKLSYRENVSSSPGRSCAYRLDTVTTTDSGVDLRALAHDPYMLLPSKGFAGDELSVDATGAVRDWTTGTPNAGFLLLGIDESLPPEDYEGFTSQTCWSGYSNISLTVTYFK